MLKFSMNFFSQPHEVFIGSHILRNAWHVALTSPREMGEHFLGTSCSNISYFNCCWFQTLDLVHTRSIAITYAHELFACFFLIESFELGTTSNVGGEGMEIG
jgi:hypothetical protein